jgi:hypothetical protein
MQSTTKRGYGTKHQRLRRMWQRRLDSGETISCARCGLSIMRGMRWDLGHDDHDRSRYSGQEHERCNRRAGGRLGAMVKHGSRPLRTSRHW